tara:strand:+ start:136 stop:489 length:354 start_codon:yes stop_codon:yes gene_type:complete
MKYDYEWLLKITRCCNTVFDKRNDKLDVFLPFNEDLSKCDELGKWYTIQPIVEELKLCDRFCEKYKSIKEDDEKHFDFFNYLMDKFTKTDKKGIWVSEYQEYKNIFLNKWENQHDTA